MRHSYINFVEQKDGVPKIFIDANLANPDNESNYEVVVLDKASTERTSIDSSSPKKSEPETIEIF